MSPTLNIEEAFSSHAAIEVKLTNAQRTHLPRDPWGASLLDQFPGLEAACLFLSPPATDSYELVLPGHYGLEPANAGGWWLLPSQTGDPRYWIPVPPTLCRMDDLGRIFEEAPAPLHTFAPNNESTRIVLGGDRTLSLHLCLWRLPDTLAEELEHPLVVERQAWFSLGSHSAWQRPSDLYTYLEQGWVHENRRLWPHECRICSENDAHALYLIFKGLATATGKTLYRLFQYQLLLAVIHRQDERGGWRHGEWTENESHFRLVASALHLLMDAWEEKRDPTVWKAMSGAAHFLGDRAGRIRFGTWFLHDELELSEDAIARFPFLWRRSTVLGKTISNMMVLNTHLDTTIALHRYAVLSGDRAYEEDVASALETTQKVLGLRSLEPIYRLLFIPLRLSLLPQDKARALPLGLRALKRLGWKYIAPNLYRLKIRFPRFQMPGGYVERDLCTRNWSFFYLTINLMDMARLQIAFPETDLHASIQAAEDFTATTGVLDHWAELNYERHALGFWAESLYYLCRLKPSPQRIRRLADAIVRLQRLGMGLPPSLLGANGEILRTQDTLAYPRLVDPSMRVANIGDRQHARFLVVNGGKETLRLPEELATMKHTDGTLGDLAPGAWTMVEGTPSTKGNHGKH